VSDVKVLPDVVRTKVYCRHCRGRTVDVEGKIRVMRVQCRFCSATLRRPSDFVTIFDTNMELDESGRAKKPNANSRKPKNCVRR